MGLGDWFDERAGWRRALATLRADLGRPVPRHLNVLFSLGTVAATLFLLQVASGVLLLFYYRPAEGTAFESVEFLETRVPSGWLVRNLHVWGAHLFVAVVLLHMLRVFLYGGYKRPRELTWLLGCGLLFTGLGLAFTGSVLPWNQRGYWATTVGTEMAASVPLVGTAALRLLRGGEVVGEPTLGRFFALHVGVLPPLFLALAAAHLFLVRRLGVSTLEDAETEGRVGHAALCRDGEPFVPHHALREAIVVVLALAILFTFALAVPAAVGEKADPLSTPPGVKPEWYFLPLYQAQKYVPSRVLGMPGNQVGTVGTGVAALALLALPFLDRNPARRPSRRRGMLALGVAVSLAAVLLGVLGHFADREVEILGKRYAFDTYGFPTREARP